MTGVANDLPPCLPVPPRVALREVIEVRYTIQRRVDGLFHEHVAFVDPGDGSVLVDSCTAAPVVAERTPRPDPAGTSS